MTFEISKNGFKVFETEVNGIKCELQIVADFESYQAYFCCRSKGILSLMISARKKDIDYNDFVDFAKEVFSVGVKDGELK